MRVSKEQKRLFAKNRKFLLKKIPTLSLYIERDLPVNVEFFDGDDEIDVLINGSRFYGSDARVFAHEQIEQYLRTPSIVEGFPPQADEERTPTHLTLIKKLTKQFQKHGLAAMEERQRIDSATTFVFGIGLGYHLYPMIVHTRCRDLVITEAEPIFLLLSMYFIDWGKIFKVLKDRVAIIITQDPDSAFGFIRSHIHPKNPGVLQTMFYLCHYHSEYIDAIHQTFQDKSHLFFDGLGFYDDEKLMTRNTILNMYMDRWRFCGDKSKVIAGSAVVVGSGPSLNAEMDWLRENQHRVVIFSGGSSLQSLLSNGIVPDFHAEIENIPLNYELLKPLTEQYDLSGTVLICSSTMDTASARLFKRRIWFLREGVMASGLLAPGLNMLWWQNPTVVNTAAAACLNLGFRDVLFLGADFGTVNPEVHHSKGTSYETHDELKKVDFKFPDQAPGNFGRTVHTNIHMMNGIRTLGYLMRQFRGVVAFNGSDGALIDRIRPIRTSRYKPREMMVGKADLVDHLYQTALDVRWDETHGPGMIDDIENNFKSYISIMRTIVAKQSRKHKDFIMFLSGMYESLSEVGDGLERFNPAISGSITTQTLVMMYWWRRIPEENLPVFERICRRQWRVFLNVIEKDFVKFLDGVRQELPLVRPELFDDKGTLIVEAKPGVQNAE